MLRGGIACLSSASVRERVALSRFLFYDRRVELNRAEQRSPGGETRGEASRGRRKATKGRTSCTKRRL